MMELQGAIGIAQLQKLDAMIESQKKTKSILKEAASSIAGVKFRALVDEAGDSATFCCFILESKDHCLRVNKVLAENNAGAINFGENTWHFYPRWEHLLAGSTVAKNGWPFLEPGGKRRLMYDPQLLPASAELINRTLVYPIPVKISQERLAEMTTALGQAAKA